MNRFTLPRLATTILARHLEVMPVVVLIGARQTGKTTLVRDLLSTNRQFLSLDDFDILDLARRRPEELLQSAKLTIDEVQREPKLLQAIKQIVDKERQPGQFLLTGSANLQLMSRVSESLAGRASYLNLWPMSHREQLGLGRSGLWTEILETPDRDWLTFLESQASSETDWKELVKRGGFPTPSTDLSTAAERKIWFNGYLQTYLERDLRTLAAITAVNDFRRLMIAVSLRTGQLFSQSEVGRDIGLSQSSVNRYLRLLEASCLLSRLDVYSANRTTRLIKTPKFYWTDPGLSLHLSQQEPTGFHFENLIFCDLKSWSDLSGLQTNICYWRTTSGREVDFVIEAGQELLPIEIKSTKHPTVKDATGLRTFREQYASQTRSGLLLHAGQKLDWLTPGILAAPWWRVV